MQREKPKKEFDEVPLEVRRVTRVTTWWRRMSFRATILVGNKNGKIWVGSAKGADVSIAVRKASHEAYKNIFVVPVAHGNTVPYPTVTKFKSAIVKLLPASSGTGMKAGSSVRSVLELAGYENMLSKIIGSNNKINNALATIHALAAYKHAGHFSRNNTKATDTVEEKAPVESVAKKPAAKAADKAPAKAAAKKTSEKKVAKKPAAKAADKAPAKAATKKAPAKKKKDA